MNTLTQVKRVQKELLDAISKNGIGHEFLWIAGWYGKLAEAQVEDEITNLGDAKYSKDKEVQCLVLESLLVSEGQLVANPSTSVGHNLLVASRVAEMSGRLRHLAGTNRDLRWAAVRERFPSPEEPKTA